MISDATYEPNAGQALSDAMEGASLIGGGEISQAVYDAGVAQFGQAAMDAAYTKTQEPGGQVGGVGDSGDGR